MIILDTHVWLWWINQDQTRFKPEWTARMDIAAQRQQPCAFEGDFRQPQPTQVTAYPPGVINAAGNHRRLELHRRHPPGRIVQRLPSPCPDTRHPGLPRLAPPVSQPGLGGHR